MTLPRTLNALDHMRGTLELIAGHRHEINVLEENKDSVSGELMPRVEYHLVCGDHPDFMTGRPGEWLSEFAPDTCPVCMAQKCLEQIGDGE